MRKLLLILIFCLIHCDYSLSQSYAYNMTVSDSPPLALTIGQLWLSTTTDRVMWLKQITPTVIWQSVAPASVTGSIIMIISGTCPIGTSEASELNGVMVRGTLTVNGNVGTLGGSDTITPIGTNSAPTFTGNSGTVPAQTFTGSSANTSAVSAGTPSGTNGSVNITPLGSNSSDSAGTPAGTNGTGIVTPTGTVAWPTAPTNVPTNAATATTGNCAATNVLIGTGAANACKATAPNLTVPAEVISWPAKVPTFSGSSSTTSAQIFTGSALGTHTHNFTGSSTVVGAQTFTGAALGTHLHSLTATGTNGTVNFTPTGTNSAPVFTGTQFDNRPAYINVIFCKAN